MSTTYIGPNLRQLATPWGRAANIFGRYWAAFREDRKRRKLRTVLCDLSDRELIDIGTTRGEIDYVASHRDFDPRGIQSAV
jgi:uncharacterized protein YjiS (DUF1127 family)